MFLLLFVLFQFRCCEKNHFKKTCFKLKNRGGRARLRDILWKISSFWGYNEGFSERGMERVFKLSLFLPKTFQK